MHRDHSSAAPRWLLLGLLACWAALPGPAAAMAVELEVTPRVRASADYHPGSARGPAVLLLHGFLQTREAPVVYRLADALGAAGYTVLAPTLSLGIDLRRQSLDCDALHLHAMEDDVRELGGWVGWLAGRHPGPIVLLGHSSGALQTVAYMAGRPHPRVARAILLSLTHFGPSSGGRESAEDIERARAQQRLGEEEIDVFRLSYCDKYPAPPTPYLSYLRWDHAAVLAAIARIRRPVDAVFGSADATVPEGWPEEVQAAGARLHVVQGGDHFFRDLAEFDMVDVILRLLEDEARRSPRN